MSRELPHEVTLVEAELLELALAVGGNIDFVDDDDARARQLA